ncbi:amino acid ABC transporter permease [Aciduricibacillus chroicocephali]|uniref:Amino acid ABC transporter permease n=1 Tax=Aciduricibacillus chroicocephali TaxID=3054939 RepID=A0ABY9KX07_9BACI|nr:amino acid ABC transporter permease [Bacillaceae bacterium 44XB]
MKFDPSKFDPANIFDFQLAWDYLPFILGGVPITIIITVIGMAIGLVIGFILAAARNAKMKMLRWPARLYISFFRGIPVLVLLFILYFGLPMLGLELTAFVSACLGFGLTGAAFIAEIYRAAFNSIDRGQWEAGRALNLSWIQTMWKVIMPQAVRTAIPPLGNVFMDMLKATSLAAVITIPDLFQKAQMVAGRTYDTMTVYILAALIYWPLCVIISVVQERLEKRFSKFL